MLGTHFLQHYLQLHFHSIRQINFILFFSIAFILLIVHSEMYYEYIPAPHRPYIPATRAKQQNAENEEEEEETNA